MRRSRIWRNARLAVRNARAIRDKRGLAIGAAHRDRRSSARGHCSSSKKKTRRPHALPFLCRTRCPPWTDRASLSQACRSRRTRETWATNHGAKHEKHVRGGLQPITTFVLRACSCVRETLCGGRQHREASDSGGTYRGGFARQPGDAHRAIVCSPAGPPPRCLQSARAARAVRAPARACARSDGRGGGTRDTLITSPCTVALDSHVKVARVLCSPCGCVVCSVLLCVVCGGQCEAVTDEHGDGASCAAAASDAHATEACRLRLRASIGASQRVPAGGLSLPHHGPRTHRWCWKRHGRRAPL